MHQLLRVVLSWLSCGALVSLSSCRHQESSAEGISPLIAATSQQLVLAHYSKSSNSPDTTRALSTFKLTALPLGKNTVAELHQETSFASDYCLYQACPQSAEEGSCVAGRFALATTATPILPIGDLIVTARCCQGPHESGQAARCSNEKSAHFTQKPVRDLALQSLLVAQFANQEQIRALAIPLAREFQGFITRAEQNPQAKIADNSLVQLLTISRNHVAIGSDLFGEMLLSPHFATLVAALHHKAGAKPTAELGLASMIGARHTTLIQQDNQEAGSRENPQNQASPDHGGKKPLLSSESIILLLSTVEIALAAGVIGYEVYLSKKINAAEAEYGPRKTQYDTKATIQEFLDAEQRSHPWSSTSPAELAEEKIRLEAQLSEIDRLKANSHKTALFGAALGIAALALQFMEQPIFLTSSGPNDPGLESAAQRLIAAIRESESRLSVLRDEGAGLAQEIAELRTSN